MKWALPFTHVNFTGQARFRVNGLAIVYQAPFDRYDREQDYEIVWAEFERRFGTTKHTNDTKVKSDK